METEMQLLARLERLRAMPFYGVIDATQAQQIAAAAGEPATAPATADDKIAAARETELLLDLQRYGRENLAKLFGAAAAAVVWSEVTRRLGVR